MTTVAVDAMGGDNAPAAIVAGALLAARDSTLDLILVGRSGEIGALLPERPANLRIAEAPDAVGMADQPTQVRQKPQSSIAVGLELVKRGEADAFVSFGNTGAVMAGSLFALGRIPGIARPALGAVFQNGRGTRTLLLDVGANVECRPQHLVQFATMGKAYFERVLRHRNPSVALLNIGEEQEKGTPFLQEAYALLKSHEPSFIGNVEGNTMIAGGADVVVADGFAGNLSVKVSEGVAELLVGQLRRSIRSRIYYILGAWMLRGAFERLRTRINYQQVGGAPLLGVNGAVIIGHGRADPEAVASGIAMARRIADANVVDAIRDSMAAARPVRAAAPEDEARALPEAR